MHSRPSPPPGKDDTVQQGRAGDAVCPAPDERRELLVSIASAVPAEGGIYLANEALGTSEEEQTGVVRLKWPKVLQ
jgi:hypothetical protein